MRHVHILHEDSCAEFDVSAQSHGTVALAADLLLESPGGNLKNLNPHQAKKTLDGVGRAVRDGGAIILATRCQEGFGQSVFEEWLPSASRRQDLINTIRGAFRHGGHTLATAAGLLARAKVHLPSEAPDDIARQFHASPNSSLRKGLSVPRSPRASGGDLRRLARPPIQC